MVGGGDFEEEKGLSEGASFRLILTNDLWRLPQRNNEVCNVTEWNERGTLLPMNNQVPRIN